MRISTKGRYALRLMLDLAIHNTGEYISLKDISARQGITVKYLEQIVTGLTRAGFLRSQRGNSGGYRLSRKPEDYTVGEILRAMEGSLEPIACLDDEVNLCPRSSECLTLPFWKGLKDEENGGFYGYFGTDLKLDKDADKGCILHSRILWFFSNAYLTLKNEEDLTYAKHAYEFIKAHCIDSEYGGVFWSVTADGQPADTQKHTYNQAFCIYAMSSYYAASGDEGAIETARTLIDLIETKMRDEGGYLEAFNRDFTPDNVNEKLS